MLGIFMLLLSSDFYHIELFQKKFFQEQYQCKMDTDQDRCSVHPGLGPNCLQRLSADDKSPHPLFHNRKELTLPPSVAC